MNKITEMSKQQLQYELAQAREEITQLKQLQTTPLASYHDNLTELQATKNELERVNAELAATLSAIPDLLFEMDEDGTYINLWARDEKLLAAEKESLIGYKVTEKLPADAAATVMQALQESAKTGYSQGKRISLSLPTGVLWFELSVAVKPNNTGKDTFIILSRDITERASIEEQLRHSQKMDALGKLTGGIAHDFNNMLGVIIGYADILEECTPPSSTSYNHITHIINAANRARTLTRKLLAFSRKQPAEMEPWNINEILNQDQHILEKALTASIALTFDTSDTLGMVSIDRSSFSDAILNLCINAMHAMPNGGHLRISTHNITLTEDTTTTLNIAAGEYIEIGITDTGTGIPAEIKEKIFEPFFTTKNHSGTGLGLSQVYGFVKQSKGDIQVHSEEGKGSTFTIYLPQTEAFNSEKSTTTNKHKIQHSTQAETILVVDDELALRNLVGDTLEQHGYNVVLAEDAKSALTALAEHSINLMLTDVIMPGMNGYQLAQQVNENHPEIKIIITSGYNDVAANGFDTKSIPHQYIDKPFRPNSLLKTIQSMLN